MWRWILLPFSLFYYLVLKVRHLLYDFNILKSSKANVFTVVIGNLSFGGTGKTPITIKLLNLLSEKSNVGLVSRGYGRKTKGTLKITNNSSAYEVGDEPLLIFKSCKRLVSAVVGENRLHAVQYCLDSADDKPDMVVLDDAFQHRKLRPDYSVLLFDYQSLKTNFLFPVGNNRDIKDRIHACDCIVITKVPDDFNADALKNTFSSYHKPKFFGKLRYQMPVNLSLGATVESIKQFSWLFFSGIAKPQYVSKFLTQHNASFEMVSFKDHHTYQKSELNALVSQANEKKQKLLCTEKDWVKIQDIVNQNELWKEIFYVLKVEMYFSQVEEETLIQSIYAKYRNSNQGNNQLH